VTLPDARFCNDPRLNNETMSTANMVRLSSLRCLKSLGFANPILSS
jgi:hypothetical protein